MSSPQIMDHSVLIVRKEREEEVTWLLLQILTVCFNGTVKVSQLSPSPTSVLDMTLNNLMPGLQSWRFGE